jgi:hypothetical protein
MTGTLSRLARQSCQRTAIRGPVDPRRAHEVYAQFLTPAGGANAGVNAAASGSIRMTRTTGRCRRGPSWLAAGVDASMAKAVRLLTELGPETATPAEHGRR